jgi:hypothetical protein
MAKIARLVHDRHAATSDLALDTIATGKAAIELFGKLHGSAPEMDQTKLLRPEEKRQIESFRSLGICACGDRSGLGQPKDGCDSTVKTARLALVNER